MSMIQTESPYFQPEPAAPEPFGNTLGQFSGDLEFTDCPKGQKPCKTSWGLRAVASSNIVVGGAGLYSWFQNYDKSCVNSQNCQDGILSTVYNTNFWMYNLVTIGAHKMGSPEYPYESNVNLRVVAQDDAEPT